MPKSELIQKLADKFSGTVSKKDVKEVLAAAVSENSAE